MKERPILMSAPMVRAILAGAKTQTRRIVKPQQPKSSSMKPYELELTERDGSITAYTMEQFVERHSRYGFKGDRLWVRETHAVFSVGEGMDRPVPDCVAYRATCDDDGSFDYVNTRGEVMGLTVTKWTPAIHMPRWASRITLEVAGVRVEQLHDVSAADAVAEGVVDDSHGWDGNPTYPRARFRTLWQEINGDESWSANPWVWVVEFAQIASQRVMGAVGR